MTQYGATGNLEPRVPLHPDPERVRAARTGTNGFSCLVERENWAWNPFAKQFWQGPPHFMLYAPFATQEDLGGFSSPHMPVVLWPGQPDAFIIVMAQDSSRH